MRYIKYNILLYLIRISYYDIMHLIYLMRLFVMMQNLLLITVFLRAEIYKIHLLFFNTNVGMIHVKPNTEISLEITRLYVK